MLGALKFNSAKCETTCRLCLGRIKLLKNKRNMQMKQYRKDIADLLRAGKQDYARIRVEAVIREQLTLTAYEILELYLELLSVRSSLVATSKEIPRDMVEALSSVLYAASRVPDLPELTTLHKMFMQKYGKEYVSEACSDVSCSRWMVNENLRHCLTIEPPEPALKLETLSEIAQEYGVEWDLDRARRDLLGDADTSLPLPSLGAAAAAAMPLGGPIPGSSFSYQQQQQPIQMPIPDRVSTPPQQQPAAAAAGGYADVAAAAAAAVAAAQQARSAADAAARLAGAAAGGSHRGGDGSNHGGSSGGGGGGGGVPVSGSSSHDPLQGWLSGGRGSITPPPAAAAAAGAPLQMQPLPGSPAPAAAADPAAAAAKPVQGYRMQSSEEIQRAYDNAQGPPPKPNTAAAPAAADQDPAAPAAAAGDTGGSSADGDLGLPGVPHSGASGNSSGVVSEYDELQKRFEALKKS